jgi:hypothetical protein
MTVALVLAGRPDEADAGRQRRLRGQLAALGVHRIDAAEGTGAGLLTVAAAARSAGERVLICVGADTVPEPVLARLLGAGGTAAFTGVTAAGLPAPVPGRTPAGVAATETASGTPADPDVTGPGVTGPHVAVPDVAVPRVTDPRVMGPDVTGPDVTGPDVTGPDVTVSDVAVPDVAGRALAGGALVVDTPDLDALAVAAETLAATGIGPAGPGPVSAVGALTGELARRGIAVRILDAGPDSEGAVAQLAADPAARDMAAWAAVRQLTPAALYGISLGLGLIAAVWFAELAVRSKLLAVAALAGSFLFARTGSLVAATGREGRIKAVVGWLGIACGLLTELGLYAGLAVSAGLTPQGPGVTARVGVAGLDGTFGGALRDTAVASWGGAGTTGVWRLAIAAALLLGLRKLAGLSYEHTARTPGSLFPRSVLRVGEETATLPAGERLALIAVTSVFFGPRLTFVVLLAWGVLAAGYVLAGQLARSATAGSAAYGKPAEYGDQDGDGDAADYASPTGAAAWPAGAGLAAYRGDGPLARWIGCLVDGRLPPLPPILAGLLVTGVLTALGLANLPGILVLVPVEAMLLAALGALHPHDGRADWLAPALLLAGEGVYLAALGLDRHVAPWLVFALVAAVLLRHLDLACRARAGQAIPADRTGLGWEGRMLLAGAAALAGIVPLAYAALAGYLWLLFSWDFLSGWLAPADGGNVDRLGPRRRRRAAAAARDGFAA